MIIKVFIYQKLGHIIIVCDKQFVLLNIYTPYKSKAVAKEKQNAPLFSVPSANIKE